MAWFTILAATVAPPVLPAASASVRGPCVASLAGRSITTGHDTPHTAIRVPYRRPIAYAGNSTNGREVSRVEVTLEVLGLGIRATDQPASGTTWSSTVRIERYAWAGVGLYRVRGTAFTGSRALCTGTVYICVTGRNPFLTVAGGMAGALVLLAVLMILLGFRRRARRSHSALARRWGFGGLIGGVGGAVLLQQNCVAALTPALLAIAAGGGLIAFVLLSFPIPIRLNPPPGPPVRTPPPPPIGSQPPVAPPPPPRPDPNPKVRTVYHFVPSEGACRACQNHATHRVYDSAASISPNRPHVGCKCQIAPREIDTASYSAYFGAGRTVFDDRMA